MEIRLLDSPKVGDRFGHLVAIGPAFITGRYCKRRGRKNPQKKQTIQCVCRCDCGNIVVYRGKYRGEHSVCHDQCPMKPRKPRDGITKNPIWGVWNGIRHRCYNPKRRSYRHYGARGIGMCETWRNSYESFKEWAIASGYKKGLQIDRIDNDGDYSPANCRFVTSLENNRNKSSNVFLECFGERKCIAEWEEDPRCQVSKLTLAGRIRRGWEVKRAITEPSKPRGYAAINSATGRVAVTVEDIKDAL